MHLSPAMQKVLNEQVTLELEASLVYLQLSIQLDDLDLPGMTRWMRAQSEEEQVHAAKFTQHCLDRGFAPQNRRYRCSEGLRLAADRLLQGRTGP